MLQQRWTKFAFIFYQIYLNYSGIYSTYLSSLSYSISKAFFLHIVLVRRKRLKNLTKTRSWAGCYGGSWISNFPFKNSNFTHTCFFFCFVFCFFSLGGGFILQLIMQCNGNLTAMQVAFPLQPSGISRSTSKSLEAVLKLLKVHKACSDKNKRTTLPWQLYFLHFFQFRVSGTKSSYNKL